MYRPSNLKTILENEILKNDDTKKIQKLKSSKNDPIILIDLPDYVFNVTKKK